MTEEIEGEGRGRYMDNVGKVMGMKERGVEMKGVTASYKSLFLPKPNQTVPSDLLYLFNNRY